MDICDKCDVAGCDGHCDDQETENPNPGIPPYTQSPELNKAISDVLLKLKDGSLMKTKIYEFIYKGRNFVEQVGIPYNCQLKFDLYTNKKIGNMNIEYIGAPLIAETSYTGKALAFAHEFYHVYKMSSLTEYDKTVDYNSEQHSSMINDPEYLQLVKDLFPGHTDDWYEMAKHAGNQDSPEYQQYSEEYQKELEQFFNKNKILK